MELKITPKTPHTDHYQLEILSAGDHGRKEAEQFIHDCYSRAYSANVTSFLPHIMSLRNGQGRIDAALGYRKADSNKLFLERYLTQSVEHYLQDLSGSEVKRADIIEVGNLASASSGGNRLLIAALSGLLQGQGNRWVVFTATPALLNSFSRMGLHPYALSLASEEATAKQSDDWGTYYQQQPVVVAGKVTQAFSALQKKLRLSSVSSPYKWLNKHAYHMGLERAATGCQ